MADTSRCNYLQKLFALSYKKVLQKTQWLEENDILEQSYYYWQRKFRNEAYDQMEKSSLQAAHNEVSIIEIATPVHQQVPVECSPEAIKPAAVIHSIR